MQSHDITLMDRDFRIRSADEAEYIQAVAEYVNVAIDDARGAKKHVPVQNLILLASMSMADELFKERARIDALKEKIRNQSRLLLSKLEL